MADPQDSGENNIKGEENASEHGLVPIDPTSNSSNSGSSPKTEGVVSQEGVRMLIIGGLFGVAITICIIIYQFVDLIKTIYLLSFLIVGGLIFLAALTYLLAKQRSQLLKKLGGKHTATLLDIVDEAKKVNDHIQNKDLKQAAGSGFNLAKIFVSWYSWMRYRGFIVTAIGAMVVSFSGIIATILLDRQNRLIGHQNEMIHSQVLLTESSRRASLVFELSAINDKIDEEYDNDPSLSSFSKPLTGRIIALTKSFKPYYHIDNDGKVVDIPLSPEKSQLLISLLELQDPVGKKPDISEVLRKGNFKYSDFEGVDISNKKFPTGTLDHSFFKYATLEKVHFKHCELSFACFDGASITESEFRTSNLFRASFIGSRLNVGASNESSMGYEPILFYDTDMDSTNFSNALFGQTKFLNLNMRSARFDSVMIQKSDTIIFENVKFGDTSFRGTKLDQIKFVGCDTSNCVFR